MIAGVLSVEPSSIMMHSKFFHVCERMLSIAFFMNVSSLYTGITIEVGRGVILGYIRLVIRLVLFLMVG